MLEKAKGYKTVIFNVSVGLLMVWRAADPSATLPDENQLNTVLDSVFASLDALLVVGNLFLRAVTDTQVFKKF
jgi:hypothetical protein